MPIQSPQVLEINQSKRSNSKRRTCARRQASCSSIAVSYYVTIQPGEPWFNGVARIGTPVGGFSAKDQPAWYERVYLLPSRVPLAPGAIQGLVPHCAAFWRMSAAKRASYEPDSYDDIIQFNITPTIAPDRKQELFIFVNDAVIGVPLAL